MLQNCDKKNRLLLKGKKAMEKSLDSTFDFLGIVVTKEPPPENYPMPKKKLELATVDLSSILNWVMTGQLKPYPYNRGSGTIAEVTVNSAEKGVKADIIGECTIGLFLPNKSGENPYWYLNNFHSRIGGFLRRYEKGEMTKEELGVKVGVRVQEEFLQSYQDMNASGSSHRTKDKIQNPDLAYGSILEKVFLAIGEQAVNCVGKNKWTVLSAIIYYAATAKDAKWYWPQVYQTRQYAMKKANHDSNTIRLSKKDTDKFVRGIQFWHSLVMKIEAQSQAAGLGDFAKIRNSAGFFGYILCDQMLDSPLLSKSQPVLIKRIMRHHKLFIDIMPELCRGNKDAVCRWTDQLDYKILKKHNKEEGEEEQQEEAA